MTEAPGAAGPLRATIREAESTDIPAIHALFREVEPDQRMTLADYEAWWRWLLIDNPSGRGFALGAFVSDGRCVGHVAMAAFRVVRDGETVTGGFPCKLMVSETHRRTLVYPTLVRRLLRDYPARGFALVFAPITRPRVLQANLALGFKRADELLVLARPLKAAGPLRSIFGRTGAIAAPLTGPVDWCLRAPLGLQRQANVEVADMANADLDAFPEMAPIGPLKSVRDPTILRWRYMGLPQRGYRVFSASTASGIAGYVALRRMRMREFEVMAVVDLWVKDDAPSIARALLRRAHDAALDEGVDMLTTMVHPESSHRPLFARAGYLRTPETFTVVTHQPSGTPAPLHERHAIARRLSWFEHDFV